MGAVKYGNRAVCGKNEEIYDEKAGRTEVCNLVGILSDVPSNKKYGVKMLYAPISLKGKTIIPYLSASGMG